MGFGKRSMKLYSRGVKRNTAATMLNSPTDMYYIIGKYII
jgi:hypothetical protein